MKALGVQPDNYTYSTLLAVASKQKDVVMANELLQEIKSKRIKMTLPVVNAALSVFVNANQVKQAEDVFNSITSMGLFPDNFSFAMMMTIYSTQNIKEAGYAVC